jgi:hypothetical protein
VSACAAPQAKVTEPWVSSHCAVVPIGARREGQKCGSTQSGLPRLLEDDCHACSRFDRVPTCPDFPIRDWRAHEVTKRATRHVEAVLRIHGALFADRRPGRVSPLGAGTARRAPNGPGHRHRRVAPRSRRNRRRACRNAGFVATRLYPVRVARECWWRSAARHLPPWSVATLVLTAIGAGPIFRFEVDWETPVGAGLRRTPGPFGFSGANGGRPSPGDATWGTL